MEEINLDIDMTRFLLDGKKISTNYNKVYFSTNENLEALFSRFSVLDKDVLVVLASSDQLFLSHYLGAKSVDSFDINKLTKYYYFLRKWGLEYLSVLYPDESIFRNNIYIHDLLELVQCKTLEEEKAYCYWNNYINNFFGFQNRNLFYMSHLSSVPIKDLSVLRDSISKAEFNFFNIDISAKNIVLPKKYHLIITSNISEYFNDDTEKLKNYKDNLASLLHDDGIIISSHMMERNVSCFENLVFKDEFDSFDFGEYKSHLFGLNLPIGYSYIKKKNGVNKK